MQYRSVRNVMAGFGMMLLFAAPDWADTAAGMQAFKNKDYGKAFKEWKEAADAGQAEAQFDLGVLYAQGKGVLRDLTTAERWYRKSADQGNAEAEFALGQMYSRGWGVPARRGGRSPLVSNGQRAGLRRSRHGLVADRRLRGATGSEAGCLLVREGRTKGPRRGAVQPGPPVCHRQRRAHDEEQAVRWVRASASQGFPPAQAALGTRYANGLGIQQDTKRAYFWLTLAYLHGEKNVEKVRSAQAAKLSPADVSTTDQTAQNWKPRVIAAAKK